MATTLQELRKEAGYRTAKDFAEALDVPPTTYARYEQSPEKIPLKQAWMIADKLSCSIDAVVGREHVDVKSMRGDVQKFYDSLDTGNRDRVDEFFDFIRHRMELASKRKRQEEKERFRKLSQYLERQLYESKEGDIQYLFEVTLASPAEQEDAFEDFASSWFTKKAREEVDEIKKEAEESLRASGRYDMPRSRSFVIEIDPESSHYESSVKNSLKAIITTAAREKEREYSKMLSQVMHAYSEAHDRPSREEVQYAIVALDEDK